LFEFVLYQILKRVPAPLNVKTTCRNGVMTELLLHSNYSPVIR